MNETKCKHMFELIVKILIFYLPEHNSSFLITIYIFQIPMYPVSIHLKCGQLMTRASFFVFILFSFFFFFFCRQIFIAICEMQISITKLPKAYARG